MSEDPKARLLIVDDDPESIPMVARALAPDLLCNFALSGAVALKRLETGELPDLILLDAMMPELDGYQVCRMLKARPRTRDIPVVFITAKRDIESETSALLAGAADFIPKPINPRVVRLRVEAQLLLRSREQALRRLNGELGQLNAELEQRVAERTRALSEALSRAETANRAKTTLLSNMSHEIRTPLNGMLMLSKLMYQTETEPTKSRRLAAMQGAAETLDRLLGNLLELSSIEANRVLLEPRDFTTEALEERLRTAIAPRAQAKKLGLAIDLERLPPRLRGDLERLSQMLLQLLDNAVKFTAEGSLGLLASVLDEHEERLHLAFAVSDTGCGIPGEARERIFGSFEQADNSATRAHPGAGLGLVIARQLAGLMYGGVRLAASSAAGSTFVADVWLERAGGPQSDLGAR